MRKALLAKALYENNPVGRAPVQWGAPPGSEAGVPAVERASPPANHYGGQGRPPH